MAGKIGEHKRGAWRSWIFPLAMVGLWCAPAAAINITYGLQSGREPALIVAAVFSVFGAAMCGLRLEMQGSLASRAITAACLAVLLAFNFSNAVGLAAGHRDHERSEALTAQTARGSYEADAGRITGQITVLDRELNGVSASSLKAEIATREYDPIFTRSKHCTDATLPDSRAHCEAWEKAKALLVAAEKRDRLAAELAGLNEQMRTAPVRESVDPQADAIVRALGFAGIAVQSKDVGYGLTLLFALGIELMAAFGASWCGVTLPGHAMPARHDKCRSERKTAPLVAVKPVGQPELARHDKCRSGHEHAEPLAAFLADLAPAKQLTPFSVLYAAYTARCTGKPKSERALAMALKNAGIVKTKADGGKAHYGVRLPATPLRLVAAE